jgi:hypothetical protein
LASSSLREPASSAPHQLAAIQEVHERLEAAGLPYWLFGGWAVDFYAGGATREHFDVDIAVWLDDVPQIRRLLEADGWLHAPEPDEDGGTGFERGGGSHGSSREPGSIAFARCSRLLRRLF